MYTFDLDCCKVLKIATPYSGRLVMVLIVIVIFAGALIRMPPELAVRVRPNSPADLCVTT